MKGKTKEVFENLGGNPAKSGETCSEKAIQGENELEELALNLCSLNDDNLHSLSYVGDEAGLSVEDLDSQKKLALAEKIAEGLSSQDPEEFKKSLGILGNEFAEDAKGNRGFKYSPAMIGEITEMMLKKVSDEPNKLLSLIDFLERIMKDAKDTYRDGLALPFFHILTTCFQEGCSSREKDVLNYIRLLDNPPRTFLQQLAEGRDKPKDYIREFMINKILKFPPRVFSAFWKLSRSGLLSLETRNALNLKGRLIRLVEREGTFSLNVWRNHFQIFASSRDSDDRQLRLRRLARSLVGLNPNLLRKFVQKVVIHDGNVASKEFFKYLVEQLSFTTSDNAWEALSGSVRDLVLSEKLRSVDRNWMMAFWFSEAPSSRAIKDLCAIFSGINDRQRRYDIMGSWLQELLNTPGKSGLIATRLKDLVEKSLKQGLFNEIDFIAKLASFREYIGGAKGYFAEYRDERIIIEENFREIGKVFPRWFNVRVRLLSLLPSLREMLVSRSHKH